MANEELEGNTLSVYAFVVKEDRPVVARDVTRGVNLSSPSVAHRQLQKLNPLGLLEKNKYGNYMLKQKTDIAGCVWIGKEFVPRLMFYSLFFMGALSAELAIIVLSYFVMGFAIETSFYFLTGITVVAMSMFFHGGLNCTENSNLKPPAMATKNNPFFLTKLRHVHLV